jgi:ligand-binding SRPBCC domain-containing protein
MKNVKIKTRVKGQPKEILKRFTQELFLKTCPPLMTLEINRYDGNNLNDEIHLVSSFLGQYQFWLTRIVDRQIKEHRAYFTDKAVEMPFPFTYWKHVHAVEKIDDEYCYIIDDITYSCSNKLLTLTSYPIVYFMMFYRRPIYVDYFNEN